MALRARRRRGDRDPFGHPLRARLLEIVGQHPGPNISELCRMLGAKWGTVQYHLNLLERAGLVSRLSHGRDRRLFPGRAPSPEAFQIAVLRRERARELVDAVLRSPGLRQRDLGEAASMSRKVLRNYVDLLIHCGLVREVRVSNSCHYYPGDSLAPALARISEEPLAALDPAPPRGPSEK